MYKLLADLRAFPDTHTCFAFGDAHHLTLRQDGDTTIGRLRDYLRAKGYDDIRLDHIEPSIEDCFMAL